MKTLDNRVRYTKMVLQQALLKILRTKGIDRVTVKELCQEAQINRGTFYLHYATPNDLLMEIEQQFVEEHMAHFSPYIENSWADDGDFDQLAGVFACILKNKEICHILMGKNGNPKFLERLEAMVRDKVIDEWCRKFPHYNRADLDYVFDFAFAGSMRLILNWIENENSLTTAQLAARLDCLGHHCHLAIPEFSSTPKHP